jgi:hypothetical protein
MKIRSRNVAVELDLPGEGSAKASKAAKEPAKPRRREGGRRPMTAVVEVQFGFGRVHVSSGGYEFWITLGEIDLSMADLWAGLQHDGSSLERIERRLINLLDMTAPAERDVTEVLAAAVGLGCFGMSLDGLPDAEPEAQEAWDALFYDIARVVEGPPGETSDYFLLRSAAEKAGIPYAPTDEIRRAVARVKAAKVEAASKTCRRDARLPCAPRPLGAVDGGTTDCRAPAPRWSATSKRVRTAP